MKKQTKNPLEILLECRIATPEEKRDRLKKTKSFLTNNIIFVGDTAYLIEEPTGEHINFERYGPKPVAYNLGKKI